ELDQRHELDLNSINETQIPTEISPFIRAINRLFVRVNLAMINQHRFVADAAHELRSPLTALSLQAERLATAPMSELAQERLISLQHGISRTRILLDQLLSMARAQLSGAAQQETVSMQQLFRLVLEDLLPMADSKQIDIGVETKQDVVIQGASFDLFGLVKNLIDNAIRYTPAEGRVDLSVREEGHYALLSVADSGPGIPPDERERVFDPFYRILGNEETGSGLGLSIVKTIADRMNARITLDYTDVPQKTGLTIRIAIPLMRQRPQPMQPLQADINSHQRN
ncbi:MAG TPA: ATP-binding protein, partial [Pseudomonadales bacterium]|nr:ATP-binding protein [Pseudomonadales bacterium]